MDVYIDCFNKLQLPVQRSLARYADWVKDFKKGPTGKESLVYGIYGITESYITNCQKEMKQVAALTPLLEPIDGVAVSYIDSAAALGNTINEMEKYYTQENYKDDAFAKGKALHQTLLKNIEDFKPVSGKYHEAIQEINDRRQLTQLKRIEEAEGKTFNYYSLAVMISAKQINKVISADTFDAEAMMKKSRNWKQWLRNWKKWILMAVILLSSALRLIISYKLKIYSSHQGQCWVFWFWKETGAGPCNRMDGCGFLSGVVEKL